MREDERLERAKTQPIAKRAVWQAWKHVRSGGESPGVDGMTIDEIELSPGPHLYVLWNRLSSGSYLPPPVREMVIPKGNGKERRLGIPTVLDRVAQQVIRAELEEEVEPRFHADSYGYRPGRSAHDALAQCKARCLKQDYAIDLDIRAFFDTIDHEKMIKVLRRHTKKTHIWLYCERWLKAAMQTATGEIRERDQGTPQGGVISPLLANLYLHEAFDAWMAKTHPTVGFERYADDIVVHVESAREADQLLEEIRGRLGEYSLTLSEEKTRIVRCWRTGRRRIAAKGRAREFDFLGHTFRPRFARNRRGETFWTFWPAMSRKSEQTIGLELKRLALHRWQDLTLPEVALRLAPKLRGWIGYFGRYSPGRMNGLWWRLNVRLVKWVRRKFKLQTFAQAMQHLRRECALEPDLFFHWSKGFTIGGLPRRAV